ncbi:sperm-specific protein PHI-2B-like [Gigantopelta aegis]|uniref:sperm-specific protein PHI-2B-like n=1 Tax=Gigantopelta aegis TaxID=1735272 RepID=UPI001B8895B8|nr:sperm-specific protein PHI-2B-like [Gigantopelta aegis]
MSNSRSRSKASRSKASQPKSRGKTPVDDEGAPNDDVETSGKMPSPKKPSMVMKVVEAINAIKDKKGTSAQAIQKYLATTSMTNIPPALLKWHIKKALTKGLNEGILVRPRGSKTSGASGRFHVSDAKAGNESGRQRGGCSSGRCGRRAPPRRSKGCTRCKRQKRSKGCGSRCGKRSASKGRSSGSRCGSKKCQRR